MRWSYCSEVLNTVRYLSLDIRYLFSTNEAIHIAIHCWHCTRTRARTRTHTQTHSVKRLSKRWMFLCLLTLFYWQWPVIQSHMFCLHSHTHRPTDSGVKQRSAGSPWLRVPLGRRAGCLQREDWSCSASLVRTTCPYLRSDWAESEFPRRSGTV